MYQALYRKYRPTTFEEVVGQKVIIKTLTNSVMNNKLTHAYLFTGPRGTGKTSVAKILAKVINCENLVNTSPCNKCVSCTQTLNKQNTDIIEIDAASNNGVDEIREIRDKVGLVPSYGKYKVYIIDEVHMLTTAAFNALLKTLEEPPSHIIFILATTEPHKIPATILSRCQRFDFKKISVEEMNERIINICEKEKIEIDKGAINLITKLSDGGMRDSLSLLDQLISYTNNKITEEDVNTVYGSINEEDIYNLIINVLNKDISYVFKKISEYNKSGKNLIKIMELTIEYLKNVLIFSNCSDYFNDDNIKNMYCSVNKLTSEENIYKIIEILLDFIKQSKITSDSKLLFELAIIKIIELDNKNKTEQKIVEVYEKNKEIKIENKIKKKEISYDFSEKIEEIKQIRINNTLALFNKKQLLEFKKKFELINDLLMDPEYSSIISLLLDGDIKAKGDNYLIFVFDSKGLDEYFNSILPEIEKALNNFFKIELKPIAISIDTWEIIKKEFNNSLKENKKIYDYIEEKKDLMDIFKDKKENEIKNSTNNEIEEMFDEILVYN